MHTNPVAALVRQAGFTLVELMISVVLVVFLILGINQIFFYTSQAVGVGEAINQAVRDARAAQGTFSGDLGHIVPPGTGGTDSASLIISSYPVFAFRDAADQASSRSGRPELLDLANTGNEGDASVPGDDLTKTPWVYNFRNHRLDTLSFFSRDLFRRQTGNLGTYVDNMASPEAWVWYGHAWLPDNGGSFTPNTLPGSGNAQSNPNNRFGSQFVLARMAVLLKEKTFDLQPGGTVSDQSGVNQRFFDRTLPYPSPGQPATDLEPLAAGTAAANANGDTSSWYLQQSRFDLAATTTNAFRNKLLSYVSNVNNNGNPSTYWWVKMMTPTPGVPTNRFMCNPFVPKPIDSVGTAQASSYFLGGCSQFIVEYAGDYIVQDNNVADTVSAGGNPVYGQGLSAGKDGQIDYVLVPQPDGSKLKQIVWYGLPRSTSGLTTVNPLQGDVIPLNDWIVSVYKGINPYTFEKTFPTNYSSMPAGSQYLCAWGPNDRPPMLIRITITITDTSGRIPQGLTYQYVYPVPVPDPVP